MYRLTPIVVVLSIVLFSLFNWLLPVTDPVESNYALTAKEMLQSGDWLSPQIYHTYWYDKPIMIYWLIALSYKCFGVGDFAARFPSALFAAMTVGSMYQWVRTLTGKRFTAVAAAVILGTSLQFWILAHGIVTDMVLAFFSLGIMYYAYRGLEENSTLYMCAAYGFAAGATLTKGPVGIVLPGLLLLVYVLTKGRASYVRRLFSVPGLSTFLAIALPWYAYMYAVHGTDFINEFLGLHNVTRALEAEHPEADHWWYYLAMFFPASLPWTGAILYECFAGARQVGEGRSLYVYHVIWGLGTIFFYSLMATKYPTYAFISLLPFSVLGAIGAERIVFGGGRDARGYWLLIPAVLLWLIFFVASIFVKWGEWYLLYAVVPAGIVLTWALRRKGKMLELFSSIGVITVVVSVIVIYQGMVPFVSQRSSGELRPVIASLPGDVYFVNGYSTSLVYYDEREITRVNLESVHRNVRDEAWEGKYPMKKIDGGELTDMLLKSNETLVIVVPERYRPEFEKVEGMDHLRVEKESGKWTVYVRK